jgi:cytosine/adenosine deaminase-related metal-dependent hydrolase
MTRLLIRNGTVLDPTTGRAERLDVLIADGVIQDIAPALTPDAAEPEPLRGGEAEVIDGTGRVVVPGFVDAHRHTWQATLRGIAPDVTLGRYLELCLQTFGPRYTAADIELANLAGALECLDAGITTVFDWSHLQLTPAHTDAAIEGLRRSGIRAVFAYGKVGQADFRLDPAELRRVQRTHFERDGLVSLAIGATGAEFGPPDLAIDEWRLARDLGVPVSAHVGGAGSDAARHGVEVMLKNDLLGEDVLLSHANAYDADALAQVAEAGTAIAVSPTIEPVMGHGMPVTGRARNAGVTVGLGADVVTSGPGDMFSIMRAAYLLARAQGEDVDARDVLEMATVAGARAVGLGGTTGALRVGLAADVVLLRTDLLGTAPVHDPVAAVTLEADTRAVDTVIVGGQIVKRDGQLIGHDLPALLANLQTSANRLTATTNPQ